MDPRRGKIPASQFPQPLHAQPRRRQEDRAYFTIELGPEDRRAAVPDRSFFRRKDLPSGEANFPGSPRKMLAQQERLASAEIDGREVPRYLIPAAGAPGSRVTMNLPISASRPVSRSRFRSERSTAQAIFPKRQRLQRRYPEQLIAAAPGDRSQVISGHGRPSKTRRCGNCNRR